MNTNPPGLQNVRQPEHIPLMGGDVYAHFTGADTAGQSFAAMNVYPPGAGVPPHVHEREDEVFYLEAGELEVLLGTETLHLKAGDSAFLPRGVPHAWKVVSAETARFLLVVTPAGLENLFRELSALPPGPPDGAVLGEIAARHGIHFL